MDSLSSVIQLPPPHSKAPTDNKESRNYLLYFIPGCPGPVAYYETFLSNLHVTLNSATPSSVEARFEVLGRSLASRNDGTAAVDKLPSSTSAMIGEIELLEASLLDRVGELAAGEKGGVLPKVILVGHGAGGYIALELRKRLQSNSSTAKGKRIELAGTVCLFPSVSMKSVAGTISQAVLSALSSSALFVHALVKCILFPLPSKVIEGLLRTSTGLSGNAAKVTSEMIGSEWGIYEALTLWRNQMEDRQSGRWDDAIFSSNIGTGAHTYMLFGQNDNEPSTGRGKNQLEHIVGIHISQLPDFFFMCQSESASVAKLVQEYVEEIVRLDISS